LLDRCGLYKKYQLTDDLACQWFIGQYCIGGGITECRRKKYYLRLGVLPSDNMLPSGAMVGEATEREQLFLRS